MTVIALGARGRWYETSHPHFDGGVAQLVRARQYRRLILARFKIAEWSSPVARVAHNHKAASSNLASAPNFTGRGVGKW